MGLAFWNDARESQLRELWLEGFSGLQIARIMGASSRNVICGKLARLGLAGRPGATRPAKPVPVKPARSLDRLMADLNSAEHIIQRRSHKAKPKVEAPAFAIVCEAIIPPAKGSATLMDLTPDMCRWPYGSPRDLPRFRYCGQPRESGSGPYCKAHHGKAIDAASTARAMRKAERAETDSARRERRQSVLTGTY